MNKILLLGGAGFIGQNLAKFLGKNSENNVTIADNFFRNNGKIDDELIRLSKKYNISIIKGDFTNKNQFKKLNKFYDQVYMLASIVGVDYANEMPHEIIRVNTGLIYNTLEWLREFGCGKVVFTSTSECYAGTIEAFNYSIPTPEEVPLTINDISHPRFTYAATKILGESGFLNYSRKLNFECSIIRYHNVFGPKMGFKHVIPHLAQRFYNKEKPFKIYGAKQTRSFNYIDDALKGTILTMNKGKNGEIYHIGSKDEISIEKLEKYTGKLFNYNGEYIYGPEYSGSISRRCPDISKAENDLGYKPKISWETGVKKTIKWYKKYLSETTNLFESFYIKK